MNKFAMILGKIVITCLITVPLWFGLAQLGVWILPEWLWLPAAVAGLVAGLLLSVSYVWEAKDAG